MEIRWSEPVPERVERFYCAICGLGADAIDGVVRLSLRCPRDGGWTMHRVGVVDPRMPLTTAPKSALSALVDWHSAEVQAWEKLGGPVPLPPPGSQVYPAITIGDHAREEDEAAVQPQALREAIDHAFRRAGIPLRGDFPPDAVAPSEQLTCVHELSPDNFATKGSDQPLSLASYALARQTMLNYLGADGNPLGLVPDHSAAAQAIACAQALRDMLSMEHAFIQIPKMISLDPETSAQADQILGGLALATPEGRAFLADPDAVRRAKDVVGQLDRGLLGEADAFAALPRGMTVALARAIAGAR